MGAEKVVTVCVPGYNVEKYLEHCLKTLTDHKYTADIEVLVIDDGSTDGTASIARRFEKLYPETVRLIQKENGGHGSTINCAVREGHGRYFMVVDGDDWVDSGQFAELIGYIKANGTNVDIISSNYCEIDMRTGVRTPWFQRGEMKYFREVSFQHINAENIYFTMASSWINLAVLKKVDQPLQEKTFYVDVEYILFPIPYIKTILFVDYCIYQYRRGNVEQSVYIPTMVKRYDHHERVMKSVLNYKKKNSMSEGQAAYYNAVLKRILYTHYSLFLAYEADRKLGWKRGSSFDLFLREVDPESARWIAGKMPILRIARKYEFDYEEAEKSIDFKAVILKMKAKERLKSNRIIHWLAHKGGSIRLGIMKLLVEWCRCGRKTGSNIFEKPK